MKTFFFSILTALLLSITAHAEGDRSDFNPEGALGAHTECPNGMCDAAMTGSEKVGRSKIHKEDPNRWDHLLPGTAAATPSATDPNSAH